MHGGVDVVYGVCPAPCFTLQVARYNARIMGTRLEIDVSRLS